jgi:anti-anti-sigma regulatory factor
MIVESYEDVISLSGALRSNFWDTLHTAISLTLKRHPSGVILDCSGLTEVTPAGGQTFRDVMEFIHNHDARVIVAAVPPKVLEVLRSVSEVRSQIALADSVEDARRSLDLLAESAGKPGRRRPIERQSKIVVCITGEDIDAEALHLAVQLGEAREAELHLVFIVLVPRDLPLTAPLAREERTATEAIDKAKAVLDKTIRFVPHVERGRDLASALHDLIEETKASLLVLPLSPASSEVDNNARMMKSVLTKIREEVIFVRTPCEKANGINKC